MSYDAMLGLKAIGYGFRIQSNGNEILESLPKQQQAEKERLYKKEMDEFTEFLRKEFLK